MLVTEEALAMAERLFEPLGDVIFCVKDLQGRYTTVNGAFFGAGGFEVRE